MVHTSRVNSEKHGTKAGKDQTNFQSRGTLVTRAPPDRPWGSLWPHLGHHLRNRFKGVNTFNMLFSLKGFIADLHGGGGEGGSS